MVTIASSFRAAGRAAALVCRAPGAYPIFDLGFAPTSSGGTTVTLTYYFDRVHARGWQCLWAPFLPRMLQRQLDANSSGAWLADTVQNGAENRESRLASGTGAHQLLLLSHLVVLLLAVLSCPRRGVPRPRHHPCPPRTTTQRARNRC